MKRIMFVIGACLLSACLEAQPEPKVKDRASSEFTLEVVSDELVRPWGVATLPDRSYLVTEIEGTLKHLSNGKTKEISGLPDDLHVDGQGGLLGIVLDPDFENNRVLYLAYSYGDKASNGTAIFKARFDDAALSDGQTIFKTSPPKDTGSHFGGRMAFLGDGSLVLTLGDGFTYREAAQNLNSHLGKIVRLQSDGTPAVANPFTDKPQAKPEIYSYGHRNVQGVFFDEVSGKLWAHEHGPRGGDELNLIKAGANYGWPIATTGVDYNGARITPHTSFSGTEPFVYDWVPSIAPSGLIIYRGGQFPEWQGDAFIGALVGQSLWRIDLEGEKAVGEERLLADLGARIRDVAQDQDGAILVLSESETGGALVRLLPKQ